MTCFNTITFDFLKIDELAIMITLVGYSVVFLALAIMVFFLNRITDIKNILIRHQLRKQGTSILEKLPETPMSGDENAAICTALYLYFSELHDEEKYVMTVKKVSKIYSPWSSKIYGIMNSIRH